MFRLLFLLFSFVHTCSAVSPVPHQHELQPSPPSASASALYHITHDPSSSSITYTRVVDNIRRSITYHPPSDPSFLSVSARSCGSDKCKTQGPWQQNCIKSLCQPLCTHTVYDVEVKSSSDEEKFTADLESPQHQNAIQGLFLGVGCSEQTSCCPKDDKLVKWIESKIYNGAKNPSNLPLPYCHNEKDRAKACEACKVSVTVKPKGDEECEKQYKPYELDPGNESFQRAKVPPPPENPVHKSYKEKCKAVNDEVAGAAGAMQSAFEGYVCGCLGCCDDQKCPYTTAFNTVEQAESS